MKAHDIQLSSAFKAQATKAIVAIIFFAFTYVVILLFAVGLTALCLAGGYIIISIKPMFLTIAIGVGLASMGVLILIFLLKFIFKSHKVDRSHLIEIKRADEPELFNMIDDIVQQVGTSHPKKVFLSADVNAAVFYDSSFWSMLLPVKKNLQIGLGLVNTVTKEELKAILSHEFGHFSQRTMKVGSYVHNVNQIIFNMLYDNQSYEEMIQRWANASTFFAVFVNLAVGFNEGIQTILKKLYEVVNKSYMGLSREMEFHADEIAASVTGFEPLKSSLLRMSLADVSFNNVLNYYNGKISDNIKSENIYRDHTAVLNFLAEANNLSFDNILPQISLEEQSRFDKSKLVIKDQWASHPTDEERIKRLEKTGFHSKNIADTFANDIFRDIEDIQRKLTNKLFESVSYEGEAKFISFDKFQNDYQQEVLSNSFAKIYNRYYDNKNPNHIDLDNVQPIKDQTDFNELFSDDKIDLVYTAIALQNDIEILKNIANVSLTVKTFDYDGVRYQQKDADTIIEKLNTELDALNTEILKADTNIYAYFKKAEDEQSRPKKLESLYREFFEFDKSFESRYDIYNKLVEGLQFVSITTPFEQISANLSEIESIEEKLKAEIMYIMSHPVYGTEITSEIKQNLEQYTSKKWEYFSGEHYNDDNLNILYTALHNYANLLLRGYFLLKKRILTYQEELIQNHFN